MTPYEVGDAIIGREEQILVSGAGGFLGTRVVKKLLDRGFRNIRCFVRSARSAAGLHELAGREGAESSIQVFQGNLLSPADCLSAAQDVKVIYHLAAGRGEKFYADAFLNSVVTTRNLIEASLASGSLQRFVNVSSFSVYTNQNRKGGRVLDESCPVEENPHLRGEAYAFAKVKQDEIVAEYGAKHGLPYVIVRPGHVFGPGNEAITGRVGIDTFGFFLHMGGPNRIPFTYVDNCADAIVLAGLKPNVEGEVFNVVDDDLPSSRQFLRQYKKNVRRFRSIYVPHVCSYLLCWVWERYSEWSERQLPPVFNRRRWHAFWKRTRYSNQRIKERLGWKAAVPMKEGLLRYFEACRVRGTNA